MNFSNLEHFVRVAELLNFSKAADSLYMSQPALSKEIKQLESELGFQLFVRESNGVSLTKAGLCYYRGVIAILDQHRQLLSDSQALAKSDYRVIVVGGHLLNPQFMSIAEGLTGIINSRNVPYEVQISSNDASFDANWFGTAVTLSETSIAPDDIDLLFNCREIEESDLLTRRLYNDRLLFLTSNQSSPALQNAHSLSELKDFYLAEATIHPDYRSRIREILEQAGITKLRTRKKLTQSMGGIVSQLAANELLVVSSSVRSLIPVLELAGIVEIPIEDENAYLTVVAAYHEESKPILACIEALEDIAEGMGLWTP